MKHKKSLESLPVVQETLNQTHLELGFMHAEQGPLFLPSPDNLPVPYKGKILEAMHTTLLVTDKGNPVLTTSLIRRNPSIKRVAEDIESYEGQHQYSDDIQRYFLKGVKDFVDNGAGNTKRVTGDMPDALYYGGNTGTNNGRLLRVYFAPIGAYQGIPVIAKVGACRTKESESKLYNIFSPGKRRVKI